MMRYIFFSTLLCVFSIFSLNAQQVSEKFYYYQGQKIHIKEEMDKMYIKLVSNISKEQIHNLINSDTSLQIPNLGFSNRIPDHLVFETKKGKEISRETIKRFKKTPGIVSVEPLFQYNNGSQGLTDEFVVKLKETTSYGQLQELAKQNNCNVKKEDQFVRKQFIISISASSDIDALQMSNLFYETGLFEFSEPNFVILNAFNSDDPLFAQQYYVKNTGQNNGTVGIDIKAEQAWAISTGSNVKVAVVDMGVDLEHPDLKANMLPGFDASGSNNGGAPVWSTDNHGTACAGIIGAIQNNKEGMTGIAPVCKIIPIHASDYGSILPSDYAANAINWAWQNGADIISNSWGGGSPYTPLTNAIDAALSQGRKGKGCVVVFSSGNAIPYTDVTYPANLSGVISVGAVNKNGMLWDYSCRGTTLSVVAPSGNINIQGDVVTTDRMGTNGYETGNYTSRFGGTSAACPQVAGVAALMLSANQDLTSQQVKQIIEQTTTKLSGYAYSTNSAHPNGTWNNDTGYGLVNAYAAVNKAKLSLSVTISGKDVITRQETYTVNNIPSGVTVVWSVDNNNNFNVASSGAKTAVVTAKGYNKKGVLTATVKSGGTTIYTVTTAISSAAFSIQTEGDSKVVSCAPRRYTAPLLVGSYVTWEYSSSITATYKQKDSIDIMANSSSLTDIWLRATVKDSITGSVLATETDYLTNITLSGVDIKVLARVNGNVDGENRIQYVLYAGRVPSGSNTEEFTFSWANKDPGPYTTDRMIIIESDANSGLLPWDPGKIILPPHGGQLITTVDSQTPSLMPPPDTTTPVAIDDPHFYVPLGYAPDYAIVTLPKKAGYYGAVTCAIQDKCGNVRTGEVAINNSPAVIVMYSYGYNSSSSTITLTRDDESDISMASAGGDLDVELYSQTTKMLTKKAKTSDRQISLNVNGLKKGMYVLVVSQKGKKVLSQTVLVGNK